MKRHTILATCACLVAVMTAVVVGCKKEKNEVKEDLPDSRNCLLGVYDNELGSIMTFVSPQDLEDKLNQHESKNNQFIVESVSILDENPTDNQTLPEIKITIIDAEAECSYTTWLMDCFVDKAVSENRTNYYLDQDVVNGDYVFSSIVGDSLFIISVTDYNNYSQSVLGSSSSEGLNYAPFRPKWSFTCKSKNCNVGECEKVETGLGQYHYTCLPCSSENASCERVTIIDMIVQILSGGITIGGSDNQS